MTMMNPADVTIDQETTRKPGNPEPGGNNQYQKKEVVNHDNIMNYQTDSRATQGKSIEYTLRRLRKDHPEVLVDFINQTLLN